MSIQKNLYVLLAVCLLSFFILLISNALAEADNHAEIDAAKQDTPVDIVALGIAFLKNGQFDGAISEFNKAIKINPENVDAYYYRGCAYFSKEKFKKALSDYNKAIEIDPGYVNAYINRGYYYHTISQYPRAIQNYKKALELNPDSPTAKQLLDNAVTDSQLYHDRVRDNTKLKDQGITIRNDHAF